MPRSLEEVYAEIAAWPLAERLRLAARIVAEAAQRVQPPEAARQAPPPGREAPASKGPAPSSGKPPSASSRPVAQDRPSGGVSPRPPVVPPPASPRRLIIVDGSNFLGTVAGFDLATEVSREELITRLQEFAHDHPAFRLVTYFDGQKTSVKRAGGVEVRFTPREPGTRGAGGADFFILEALRALGEEERRHALLVTADRALSDAARRLDVKVEAPASFHRRLPGVKRTAVGERGLSAAEVADWEQYFQRPPDRGRKGG